MKKKPSTVQITLSVHGLVDFLLRSGDIDNRVFNRSTMLEGTKIHAYYQKKMGLEYLSEYPLKSLIKYEYFEVMLEGRADGIFTKDGLYFVDEIKSTVQELTEFRKENLEWHLGQAKCYAYMFMLEKNLDKIGVRLTYIRQGDIKDKLIDDYIYTKEELETYVLYLIARYFDFYKIIERKYEERNSSIETLKFPFEHYRLGQRKLAKYVYSLGINGGQLYVEAPTGIGKTMSTLFPFVKALKDNREGKIFYLTAKNSGKESAKGAMSLLKKNGLKLLDIYIQAKDKICFCKGKGCNPEECIFTKEYYTKLQKVITQALLDEDTFSNETIIRIAKREGMCPFELSLDLSLFSDVIVCDYNYAFDPNVYMKRYFDQDSSNYLFLVDEAHNLVDRSLNMYSASFDYNLFYRAKKSMRQVDEKKIKNSISKLNKVFKRIREEYQVGESIVEYFEEDLYRACDNFLLAYQDLNKNKHKLVSNELTDLFLEINKFVKISELVGENYISFYRVEDGKKGNILIKHSCLDASKFIRSRLKSVKASVLFSATLSPIKYYINRLGGDESTSPWLILPSPFPRENFKLLVAPKLSIRYKDRKNSYQEVASYLEEFVSHKIGNYFIYLPSYEYLEEISQYLEFKNCFVYKQERDMSDEDKEYFISRFVPAPKVTTIALAIIGGAFAEGVDLVADRLIGAAIVGVGLAKVNFETDQISKYFDSLGLKGNDYAYLYPGMNKVMQAVGRVIRSEEDKGSVLLIDERYMLKRHKELFKKEWEDYEVVLDKEDISNSLCNFFKK